MASLQIRAEHCNPVGVCHGGVLFALADDTVGAAVHPICPAGMTLTSAQANIHFVRSAQRGDLMQAETRVLNQGRRTVLLESRVTDQQGRLAALVTSTVLFVEPRS